MDTITDATLSNATGSVFVEREGVRISLNEGDGIYESDLIITGPDTTADITFRDGTKSRLSPDTELKLVDFDFGAGEEPSFIMDLAQGALRTVSGEVVKLNPEAFELVTPRATVGIRGTEFVNIVDGANETHVVLFISDGHIMKVTDESGQSVDMSAPLQMLKMQAGENGPLTIQKFSMAQMEQMIDTLAPTLAENFPENEAEQGEWQTLDAVAKRLAEEEAEEQTVEKEAATETLTDTSSDAHETVTTTTPSTTTVIIADATDPNNDVLIGALNDVGLIVDVINPDFSVEDTSTVPHDSLLADASGNAGNAGNSGNEQVKPTPEPEPEIPDGPGLDPDLELGVEPSGEDGTFEGAYSLGGDVYTGDSSDTGDLTLDQKSYTSGTHYLTFFPDDAQLAVVAGDFENANITNSSVTFEDDTIIIMNENESDINLSADSSIFGDVVKVEAVGSDITFGNDEIILKGNVERGATVYGDARSISASDVKIIFGNDKITVEKDFAGTIVGDFYESTEHADGGLNAVTFGDDKIKVDSLSAGGKIYGDFVSDTGGLLPPNVDGGHDTITVTNSITADGEILIDAGLGNDEIFLKGGITATVGGNVTINGGSGNDTIKITGDLSASTISVIDTIVTINGGSGDDTIEITGDLNTTASAGHSATINIDGGDGTDTIEIDSITMENGLATISGGDGKDTITITNNVAVADNATLEISGGSENDIISIGGSVTTSLGGSLTINGGAGDDEITIVGLTEVQDGSGDIIIDGGAGNDTISLNGGIKQAGAQNITLAGGTGSDTFNINVGESNAFSKIRFSDFDPNDTNEKIILEGVTANDINNATVTAVGGVGISVYINGVDFVFEATYSGSAQDYYNTIVDQITAIT